MKNHIFEKNAFESLETPEMTGCHSREFEGKLLFPIEGTPFPFSDGFTKRGQQKNENRQNLTVWDLYRYIDIHSTNRFFDLKSTSDRKTNDIT